MTIGKALQIGFALAGVGGEALLQASSASLLAGIPGTAFYAVDLDKGKTLFVPLGREIRPAYAASWLSDHLPGQDDLLLWSPEGLRSLRSSAFLPLTRRLWRAARRAP